MNFYKLSKLYDSGGDISKRWFVGFHYQHPETGKYEFFKEYVSSKLRTKTARRKKANEMIQAIDNKLINGWSPYESENLGKSTVINGLNKILEIKEKSLRKRTLQTYSSHINTFYAWLKLKNYESVSVESFSYRFAQEFADYLKTDKNLTNRTYNNYVERFRSLFNELVDREYMLRNPFKKIKMLPITEQTIQAFSDEEVRRLREHCIVHAPLLWLVCQFIYYCAIRPNELVQLKIRNIDIQSGNIFVAPEISKSRRNDVVRIPTQFLEDLKKWNLAKYNPDFYLFSKGLEPGPDYIYPTRLAEKFRKEAKKIGIQRRLYDLKHTGAGRTIQNGFGIRELQAHLRHRDINTTEIYLRAFSSTTSDKFVNEFPAL